MEFSSRTQHLHLIQLPVRLGLLAGAVSNQIHVYRQHLEGIDYDSQICSLYVRRRKLDVVFEHQRLYCHVEVVALAGTNDLIGPGLKNHWLQACCVAHFPKASAKGSFKKCISAFVS